MQLSKKRGNRIRASDKSLVFRFSAGSLFMLFFMAMLLLNLKAIITTDWNSVTLFSDGSIQFHLTPYRIVTLIISAFTCLAAVLLYYRFRYDKVKQLFHRQKLACMILENGWYEAETLQDGGIFKDLPSDGKKERITYFPKMYYRMENGLLHIQTEITLGKYQDQLLHLEKKLETGLYCELVSKELHDSYVEYVLLYDTIANRITINEVRAEKVDHFYNGMMERSKTMKLMENYKTGENYAYLGLSPHFLIFDEYVAFMEMLTTKENAAVLNKLKQIVMLGRQAGYFLILACQRPDAKYLGDGIRDQFNFRVALGRMSELGYSMMFGEVNKDFFLKQIKGRGYVDIGTSVISEFYTPLVPKEHDFLKEIGELTQNRQDGQAACGAKAAGTD